MLKDKVAWVTGAGSGIGLALSRQLNDAGCTVILSGRNVDQLDKAKKSFSDPDRAHVVPLDLEHSANFPSLAQGLIQKFGRINYLFNNGGVSQRSSVDETPIETDRKIMEVNYFGNIALTKAVLPYMQQQKSGHIVVISSIAGIFGFYLRSAYSASKHALQGFYESLALEESKNGIRVSLVYPGKINTSISVNAVSADGTTHGKMDPNQENGMSAEKCAKKILKGVCNLKPVILVGGKEIKSVFLKRWWPSVFRRVIRKQSPM